MRKYRANIAAYACLGTSVTDLGTMRNGRHRKRERIVRLSSVIHFVGNRSEQGADARRAQHQAESTELLVEHSRFSDKRSRSTSLVLRSFFGVSCARRLSRLMRRVIRFLEPARSYRRKLRQSFMAYKMDRQGRRAAALISTFPTQTLRNHRSASKARISCDAGPFYRTVISDSHSQCGALFHAFRFCSRMLHANAVVVAAKADVGRSLGHIDRLQLFAVRIVDMHLATVGCVEIFTFAPGSMSDVPSSA